MPRPGSNARRYILPKLKFLLNANISRVIIPQLKQQFGFNIIHISDVSAKSLTDEEIVKIARKQKRIIITHDLDYGEIYYLQEKGAIGVIVLRLQNQTSANVLKRLSKFFTSTNLDKIDLLNSLVILAEKKTRIISP